MENQRFLASLSLTWSLIWSLIGPLLGGVCFGSHVPGHDAYSQDFGQIGDFVSWVNKTCCPYEVAYKLIPEQNLGVLFVYSQKGKELKGPFFSMKEVSLSPSLDQISFIRIFRTEGLNANKKDLNRIYKEILDFLKEQDSF